jgi:hypothetical protein
MAFDDNTLSITGCGSHNLEKILKRYKVIFKGKFCTYIILEGDEVIKIWHSTVAISVWWQIGKY